jgi:hypothetical protein
MPEHASSPIGGDRMKKAVQHFCELIEAAPEKTRLELLHQVELKYDLSPAECEFLNNYLSKEHSGD